MEMISLPETIGERFVGAIAGRVIDINLGRWFEETDHIEALSSLDVGADVGDVHRVGEQQAYYRSTDDKLTYLRIVCSG